MKYNDMVKAILAICPGASFGEDNDGQIVVYTNKKMTYTGKEGEPYDTELEVLDEMGGEDFEE